MNLLSTVIILSITFISCSQNSQKGILTKMTLEETLTRLNNGDTQFYYATYKDSSGRDLSNDLREKLTSGKLKREFYVDKLDSIREIRVSVLKDDEDIFNEIQLRSAMGFPMEKIPFEKVNCKEISEKINKSINMDQEARAFEDNIKNNIDIDKVNKNLIISIIEKCGWSSIDTSQINDVFLLIQHMESEYMARYYPVFLEFHKKGTLSNLNYARMIDRLLMNNGFEQIYGTQVVDLSFYAIRDIGIVNIRRQKLGLDSIEEVAKRFGFKFKLD
ncbi:MAG: hypothetical protein IPM42_21090 [Saprospiraceae bacterium]|nr:hypothetical protein [Saprospiraceae bacterium]